MIFSVSSSFLNPLSMVVNFIFLISSYWRAFYLRTAF